MKFATVFAIALSVIGVFGVGMAVVTIAMLSQSWDDTCTAPTVLNGNWNDDSLEFKNGDLIVSSMITCNANYHFNTNASNAFCICNADGKPCEELQHVCVAHLCSTPNVTNGIFTETFSELENGTSLDASAIVCDNGYQRIIEDDFVCICTNHGEQCATLENACEPGTATLPPSGDDDNNEELSLDSGDDGIPDWALALIIVGDIVACVLISLGAWACYDYHDKKKAEEYWNLYMEHRDKHFDEGQPPVAIEVHDINIRNDAVSNKVFQDSASSTPVGTIVKSGGSRRDVLVSEASMIGNQAKHMEDQGNMKEAAKLYQSASEKLQEAVKDSHSSDETFGLAVRASKFEDKAKQIRKSFKY